MKKIISLICIALMLDGCLISRPGNNVGFDNVEKIKQLEGIYSNLGEGGKGSAPIYLSRLIWPNTDIDHKSVVSIEVRAISGTMLVVKANGKNGGMHESTFAEGKDFELHSGRIRLKNKLAIAGFKSGEPMVGPYYENAELGIDQRGSGKYRMQGAVAGLVYLFLPLALGVNEEVRFEKINP